MAPRERPLTLQERLVACATQKEFDALLEQVARDSWNETHEFLGQVETESPVVVGDDPELALAEDAVARQIAALCEEEQQLNTHLIAQAAKDHAALEQATGKQVDAPIRNWSSKLSKGQISKRRQGKA
jgi:hypothetical protein